MSLEEKVGQMTNLTLSSIAFEDSVGNIKIDTQKLKEAVGTYQVGSFQNVINHAYRIEEWHSLLETIQNQALALNKQKIPSLYCIDAIHGMNYTIGSTIFPHNIGMAATWNPVLITQCEQITAKECRATGIRYNFDPVLDVGREQ
jgi:beta-glucosidase